MTAYPALSPSVWAFHSKNAFVFSSSYNPAGSEKEERVTPDEWVKRGVDSMWEALRVK